MVLVKTRLQSYYDTSYSRGGVNQMWILKNSKDLLEYKQSELTFIRYAQKRKIGKPNNLKLCEQ
jgi:hypothetical protein